MGLQTRDLAGTIQDSDEANHEVLLRFPHERMDTHNTDFGRDCFRQSFQNRMPVMVWMHDLRDPIGRATKAQVLPQGNEVTVRFADIDRVPNAGRAWSQFMDGTLTDASFGFDQERYIPHPQKRGAKRFVSARMMEVSPVTFGSIPEAGAVSIRDE